MPSDGAIIIDTGLDNKGFIRDARQFKSAVDGLKNSVTQAGQSMGKGMGAYTKAMKGAADGSKAVARDQATIQKEIVKTEQALERLQAKQDLARKKWEAAQENAIADAAAKFEKNNAGMEALPWEDATQAAEAYAEDLNNAINAAIEKFGEFEDTAAFRNTSVEIDFLNDRLDQLKSELGQAASSEEAAAAAGGGMGSAFASVAASAGKAAVALAKMAGRGVLSYLRKLAEGAKNAAIQLAKLAGNAIRAGMSRLGSLIGGAVKSLLGFAKAQGKTNGGLRLGLKHILALGLGVRGLSALFNKLRGAIKEGLGELEKRDPRVRASLTALRGALNGLKGSLAAAFAPILTAVAPALTTLINLLATAINYIGMFMAALTGQGYYQAAKGVGAIGAAAGSASGAVQDLKRELAGFDDLEILSDNSGGGGGGGGGGGADMGFDTIPIDSGIADFVQRMKDLFAAGEYDEIGRIIAEGINGAFEKAKDLISWDNLGGRITEAVNAITGIFNSLVDYIDWDLMGRTFGTGVNTIVNTLNLLYEGVDWTNLGKKLASGLNGLVDEVNWGHVGELFGNKFSAVFDTLYGAVSDIKWGQIGYSFAEGVNGFFGSINWDYLQSGLTKGFTGVLEAISEAVDNIQWGQIGYALAAGINGILDLNWSYVGSVLSKALNGLFSLFGETIANINWAQLGYDLASGINSLFLGINWDYVGNTLSKALNGVIEVFGELISGIQWAQIAADVAAGLNNVFININFSYVGKKLGEGLTGIVGAFESVIDGIQWAQIAYNLAAGINDLFGSINWAYVGSVVGKGVNTAVDSLTNFVGTIKWAQIGYDFAEALNNLFGDINWGSVGKLVSGGINSITGIIGGFVGQIKWGQVGYDLAAALNGLFGDINWTYIGGLVSSGIKGILTFGKEFFDGLDKNQLASGIKDFLLGIDWEGIGQAAFELFISAFSGLAETLASLVFGADIVQEIKDAFKKGAEERQKEIDESGREGMSYHGVEMEDIGDYNTYEDYLKDHPIELPASVIPIWNLPGTMAEYINEVLMGGDVNAPVGVRKIGLLETFGTVAGVIVNSWFGPLLEKPVDLVKAFKGTSLTNWIYLLYWGSKLVKQVFLEKGFKGTSVTNWLYLYNWGSKLIKQVFLSKGFTQPNVTGWLQALYWGGSVIKQVLLKRGPQLEKDGTVLGYIYNNYWGGALQKAIDLIRGGKLKEGKTVLGTIFQNWWGGNVEKGVGLFSNFGKTVFDWLKPKLGPDSQAPVSLAPKWDIAKPKPVLHLTEKDLSANAPVSPTYNGRHPGNPLKDVGLYNLSTTVKVGIEVDKGKNKLKLVTNGGSGVTIQKAALGGYLTAGGRLMRFSAGGFLRGGMARYFGGIPQYASGTARAHGTMFIAGEAGPEIVGHIGGRTEILNKSQLAQTMYAATENGMLAAMKRVEFRLPAMATGTVMPYDVSAQIARSTMDIQNTLDANNEDLIQTIISVIGAQTAAIVGALNVSRQQSGAGGMSAQDIINEINRRTQMFSASPLVGV